MSTITEMTNTIFKSKIFIAVAVCLIAVVLITVNRPKNTKYTQEEIVEKDTFKTKVEEQAVWETTDIIPGESNYEEISAAIPGEYKGRERYNNYTVYEYFDAKDFYMVKKLGVNSKGKVSYTLLNVDPFQKKAAADYYSRYRLSEPDIVMDVKNLNNHKAEVYLKEGLMIYIEKDKDTVHTEMYFEPMSKDEFDIFWGNDNLVEKYEHEDYGEAM